LSTSRWQLVNKQCEHNLLTCCWNSIATSLLQVCYNLCVFTCVLFNIYKVLAWNERRTVPFTETNLYATCFSHTQQDMYDSFVVWWAISTRGHIKIICIKRQTSMRNIKRKILFNYCVVLLSHSSWFAYIPLPGRNRPPPPVSFNFQSANGHALPYDFLQSSSKWEEVISLASE
jgi:hypothetical protein